MWPRLDLTEQDRTLFSAKVIMVLDLTVEDDISGKKMEEGGEYKWVPVSKLQTKLENHHIDRL